MVFVKSTEQRELSMVDDTTRAKNVVKCVTSLLYLRGFGVLAAVTSYVLNHVRKNTRNNSEQI